jgi:uncharacterized RDD family membrane protein YckC
MIPTNASPPTEVPPPPLPSPVTYPLAGAATRIGAALLEFLLLGLGAGAGWLVWWVVDWDGATSPAKQVLHLRVLRHGTTEPAGLGRMARREVFGKGIALALFGGGLVLWRHSDVDAGRWVAAAGLAWAFMHVATALVDEEHRGLWDSIGGTVVVVDQPRLAQTPLLDILAPYTQGTLGPPPLVPPTLPPPTVTPEEAGTEPG